MMTRTFLFLILSIGFCLGCIAQSKSTALPPQMFLTMRDSTTSMDIVLLIGEGGSISAEGKNVKFFNAFFDNAPAAKTNAPAAGNVMWLINGREFISGNFHLGDSTGYIVLQKGGKEFVNKMNVQGNSFFKGQVKK